MVPINRLPLKSMGSRLRDALFTSLVTTAAHDATRIMNSWRHRVKNHRGIVCEGSGGSRSSSVTLLEVVVLHPATTTLKLS